MDYVVERSRVNVAAVVAIGRRWQLERQTGNMTDLPARSFALLGDADSFECCHDCRRLLLLLIGFDPTVVPTTANSAVTLVTAAIVFVTRG